MTPCKLRREGRPSTGRPIDCASFVRLVALILIAAVDPRLHITAAKRTEDPIVRTETGQVRGKRFNLPGLGKTVDAYTGIPFAQPPVGYLRFRHPQPIHKWHNVYDATQLPPSCYQEPDLNFGPEFYGSNVWNPPTAVSEDCLYLNVFVPKPRQRKLAVMVWIYGGGFYSGTTTLELYDGKILAALNSVVVVSIGYRLGALGFLSLDHPTVPGNAGLFDQLMGLEWIQQNIRYFGGDPDNVTLFGESAGSVSVSLHLLSPLSHNKFHRAILQSGSANMPWATLTPGEARRRSTELAFDYLSCPRTDDMSRLADCLRLISPEQIVEQQWVSRGILQFPFLPVVDGVFLTAPVSELLERSSFKRCPILVGSNRNEASFFLIYELKEYLDLERKTMTRSEYVDSMERLFHYYPQYPSLSNERAMRAITFQYTDWLHPDDSGRNVHALDMAVSDSQFLCPLNWFADAYAKSHAAVYMYYFTQRYSTNPWPAWTGVLHGDEIFFTMGEALKPRHNFTEDERQLSRKMMLYWGNFAKTGDPNKHPAMTSLEEWPLYSVDRKEYLELSTRFIDSLDKWKAIDRGPRVKECAFWSEYLPYLIASNDSSSHNQNEAKLTSDSESQSHNKVFCCHLSVTLLVINNFFTVMTHY